MILVTCVLSTMVTERAARKITLANYSPSSQGGPSPSSQRATGVGPASDDEKILVCVKYPEIAPQLLNLAVYMRNQSLNRGLVALNVVYDDEQAPAHREQGLRLLDSLKQQAAAAEVRIQTQVRSGSCTSKRAFSSA